MPYYYRIILRVLYSAQCHIHHCTSRAFEQFGARYMHSLDDKHPTRPGFKPSSSEFRATAGSNGTSGWPRYFKHKTNLFVFLLMLHQIYINMINSVWDLLSDPAGLAVILCIGPLGMRVRSCLGPCGPGYEWLPRPLQAPVYDLPIGPTGSGVSPYLGHCRLGFESLPKTMPAHGKSLPWTCRFGLETLPRTLRARVWVPA